MTAADTLALLDWKRRVFSLYAAVRAIEPEAGWALWRETRDELFRSHSQSPLPAAGRASFGGLEYWPYDPDARVLAELEDVEALAAGKALLAVRVRRRLAVGVERLALELADADVSELLVHEMGNIASGERDVRGLDRAREGGDGDEVEWQRGELAGEPLRFLDPLLREPAVELRVAVHDLVDVEERLPVARDEEDPHRGSVRLRTTPVT